MWFFHPFYMKSGIVVPQSLERSSVFSNTPKEYTVGPIDLANMLWRPRIGFCAHWVALFLFSGGGRWFFILRKAQDGFLIPICLLVRRWIGWEVFEQLTETFDLLLKLIRIAIATALKEGFASSSKRSVCVRQTSQNLQRWLRFPRVLQFQNNAT